MNAPKQVTQYAGGLLRFDDGSVAKMDANGNVPQTKHPANAINQVIAGSENIAKVDQAAADKKAANEKAVADALAAQEAADKAAAEAKQKAADAAAAEEKEAADKKAADEKAADALAASGTKPGAKS